MAKTESNSNDKNSSAKRGKPKTPSVPTSSSTKPRNSTGPTTKNVKNGSSTRKGNGTKNGAASSEAGNISNSRILLDAALQIIRRSNLQALLLYVDGLDDFDELGNIDYTETDMKVVLVARSDQAYDEAVAHTQDVVRIPEVNLTRIGQIKMAVMLSFSKRLLKPGYKFLFLSGTSRGSLDTLMTMEVGQEYEMFQSVDQPPLSEHIRRAVFERVLNLALELAASGREGKPVGAIFVLGDSSVVLENSQQNIFNPFRGYPDEEKNILDDRITETVREFSSIDGAFVIKGVGTILSAGTYLLPKLVAEELPQGLGAQHAAAAAITAATKSIAITISESTGTVRIWRQGRLITEIEKAKQNNQNESNE